MSIINQVVSAFVILIVFVGVVKLIIMYDAGDAFDVISMGVLGLGLLDLIVKKIVE